MIKCQLYCMPISSPNARSRMCFSFCIAPERCGYRLFARRSALTYCTLYAAESNLSLARFLVSSPIRCFVFLLILSLNHLLFMVYGSHRGLCYLSFSLVDNRLYTFHVISFTYSPQSSALAYPLYLPVRPPPRSLSPPLPHFWANSPVCTNILGSYPGRCLLFC